MKQITPNTLFALTAKPTIRNVARAAGVSAATVSRLINGKIGRASAVHSRIRRVVAQTGYAGGGRKKQSALPFLLIRREDLPDNPDAHDVLCEQALERATFDLCASMRILRVKPEAGISGAEMLASGASGVIILGPFRITSENFPLVCLNSYSTTPLISAVDCDDLAGIHLALAHLKALGHERIAFFNDHAFDWRNKAHPRRELVPSAYAGAGLSSSPELLFGEDFKCGEHLPAIEKAVRHFLSLNPRPTALVLASDVYAPCFYEALRSRGIRIPQDMSVFGFDNYLVSSMLSPALSSIRKPFETMARDALSLLIERIANPDASIKRILVRPELVLRASTTVPRSDKYEKRETHSHQGVDARTLNRDGKCIKKRKPQRKP